MKGTQSRKGRASFRVNARGWIFLVLATSVAFAAGTKGNNLLFAVFSVLIGLFVVSGVLTVLVARRIEISRTVPEAVPAGGIFTVTLRIRNAKRFWPAFCLKFEDRLTHEGRPATTQPLPVWLPHARPGERVRVACSMTSLQRGWAKLGPITLTSEFAPGFFTWRVTLPVEDSILVLPRTGALNRRVMNPYLSSIEFADLAPASFTHGDQEFAGLREYRPGDNPRRIHWKMSARVQGRLLVREFEDARVRDADVLLETFMPDLNDDRRRRRLERAITFAAALIEALLEEGCRVRFAAFAPDPIIVAIEPGRGTLDDLLAALALLKPSRYRHVGELLAAEEAGGREARFILKIGDEPLPPPDRLHRTLVIDASDMKALLHAPDAGR